MDDPDADELLAAWHDAILAADLAERLAAAASGAADELDPHGVTEEIASLAEHAAEAADRAATAAREAAARARRRRHDGPQQAEGGHEAGS